MKTSLRASTPWSLLALTSSLALAACVAAESGPSTSEDEPPIQTRGMRVVGASATDTAVAGAVGGAVAVLPTCTQAVSQNPLFNCIWQAFVQGGGVVAMRDAALACGCTAEIVVSGTQPAPCNVQRVAVYCSGDPAFSAVSPIPSGQYPCPGVDRDNDGIDDVVATDDTEPPFIGIHLDPENAGRLCDVTVEPNGVHDRVTIEPCGKCHKGNATKWDPPIANNVE